MEPAELYGFSLDLADLLKTYIEFAEKVRPTCGTAAWVEVDLLCLDCDWIVVLVGLRLNSWNGEVVNPRIPVPSDVPAIPWVCIVKKWRWKFGYYVCTEYPSAHSKKEYPSASWAFNIYTGKTELGNLQKLAFASVGLWIRPIILWNNNWTRPANTTKKKVNLQMVPHYLFADKCMNPVIRSKFY